MQSATVDEQGRIEIPAELRRRMDINNGAKVGFELVGDHLEMHVEQAGEGWPVSGFAC